MLTRVEKNEGWELLFDGKTTDQWKNRNEDITSGWVLEDGCLLGLGLQDHGSKVWFRNIKSKELQ